MSGGGGGDKMVGTREKGGRKSTGPVRKERAGSGIPTVAETERNRKTLCNIAQYFATEKKETVDTNEGAGTGIKKCEKREVQIPCSPPPRESMS